MWVLSGVSFKIEATMDSVIIISEETIKPSSPTPPENFIYKLSDIDQLAPNAHISLIFFYLRSNLTEATLSHLKTSLSKTLSLYYPLAGRLKEELFLSCNDQGALLLHARVDSSLCTLLQNPDVAEVDKLLPCRQQCTENSKEGLELAVQVTLFSCGGVALGACASHRVVDGLSLVMFMKTWALLSLGTLESISPPIFNASSIFPPRAKPEFPQNPRSGSSAASPTVTKIFSFHGLKISSLRVASKMTRVAAVSALLWRCIIRARREEASSRAYVATHVVNLRKRMSPPLSETHFGNLWSVTATSGFIPEENKGEILCLTNNQMAESMKSISSELSRVFKISEELSTRFSECGVELCCFSSLCGFPMYEVDFGWGRPEWVARGSLYFKNSVTLMPPKRIGEEEDLHLGMEAWVSMDAEEMSKFEKDPELISILASNHDDHHHEMIESPLLPPPSSPESSLSISSSSFESSVRPPSPLSDSSLSSHPPELLLDLTSTLEISIAPDQLDLPSIAKVSL